MFHSVGETCSPPSEVTASTISSASGAAARMSEPSSATGYRTPVEVSACTTATSLVSGLARRASST